MIAIVKLVMAMVKCHANAIELPSCDLPDEAWWMREDVDPNDLTSLVRAG